MKKEETIIDELEQTNESNSPTDFSPFDEAVIEKDYRKASYQVDPSLLSRDIGEPVFTTPNIDIGEDPTQSFESEERTEPKKLNPEYDYLDDAEKKASAEFIVDFALDSYVGLKMYAGSYAEISPKKIEEFKEQGLNLDIAVPFDNRGNMVAVRDLVEDFNVQIKETFVTPKTWVDQVRPVAIRVAMKHGVGMTDEQMLGFMVVTDLVKTGFSAQQMRKTITQTLTDISSYCRSLTNKESETLQNVAESGNVVNIREEVENEVVKQSPKRTPKATPKVTKPKGRSRKNVEVFDESPIQPKQSDGFLENTNKTSSIELPSEILEHMGSLPVFDEEVNSNDKEMDFEEYKKSARAKKGKNKYE